MPNQWYDKLTKEMLRPVLPNTLPIRMQEIIERGLSNNQLLRPTAEEIFQTIDECLSSPFSSSSSAEDALVNTLIMQQPEGITSSS